MFGPRRRGSICFTLPATRVTHYTRHARAQDIIVPVDEFTELVKKAVDESELNRKLKH